MERRKVIALSVLATALLLSLAPGLIAEVETRRVLSFTEWDLRVRVYAPYQAYPGDTIEVRATAEAVEELYDVTITIDIFGSKSDAEGRLGYDSWEDDISFVSGVDWEAEEGKDREYDVDIPEDSDPGLVYGQVTAEWTTAADLEDHTYTESFTITYIMNEDYENIKDLLEDEGYAGNETGLEDLLEDYDAAFSERDAAISERDKWKSDYTSLKSDYDSMKSDYDSMKATYDSLKSSYESLESEHATLVSEKDALQKKYNSLDSEHKTLQAEYDGLESEYEATAGELNNYKTYTYALAVATVIFVVTTIIFAVRKPKTV